ncbi:MAG TPA: sugar transferase [Amaricoccus sp.]|uniref:sugar transferase n=1 Tax=Amaricoccus sp. TaxID=1872485 RepID=UPI002CCAFEFF|nr:sugar transferase [Amaricoccus sp.]HMR31264.1 sugar transferase [Geminicoccus sp.]HMU00260.1 sugar transferase [Amaricoccus sp.]
MIRHLTTRPSRRPIASPASVPRWKRALDLGAGALALVLLAPVMLVAAAAVRLSSPGPVLFRQIRIGLGERPFTMLKFRTMYVDADHAAQNALNLSELRGEAVAEAGLYRLAVDPRITPVGRILRRYSIDELPQLFNLLRGEMSLVGPRPALPWEVELFTPEQRRRHASLPGLTGLWQVSGRNRLSMQQMLDLDLAYVEHCTLGQDIAILIRTPAAVLLDRATR